MSDLLPIDSIKVGDRDRADLGNIVELADSIAAVGLLHPVVVTQDGDLIAGDRRLAAVRHLGWTEVPVTVATVETLAHLLQAEADENTCRKPLTPYEASRARERRAALLAPKAKERQGARTDLQPSAKLAEGSSTAREVRKAAAKGSGYSGSTLDKVDTIRDAAERGVVKKGKTEIPAPPEVVEVAKAELENVKRSGAAVERSSRQVEAAIDAFVEGDPNVQRARWQKNYMAAIARSGEITAFTPDAVAKNADRMLLDELDRLVDRLLEYRALVKKHARGLRLVGGDK